MSALHVVFFFFYWQRMQARGANAVEIELEIEHVEKITTTDHEKILLLKNECRHVDILLQCKSRPKTLYVDKWLTQMLPLELTNRLDITPEDDSIGPIQKRRSEQACQSHKQIQNKP